MSLFMRRCFVLLFAAILLGACTAPTNLGRRDRALIAGRTFVVTGASSGLGEGAALKLAFYGGNVVLAARRAHVLEAVARTARAYGAQALVVPTDMSRPEQVQRLAEAAVARFGQIDAWINDAAVAAIGRFDEVPLEDHARIIDVNLKGYIYGSYAALRQFRRQGYGTLVNVSSVEAYVPLAYQASYAASKAGIRALDASLTQELRLAGNPRIRVSTVLPWAIDTPFWDHMANYSGGTPRLYSIEGPWGAVDAIVWMTIHPQKEIAVGWKAGFGVVGAQLFPGLADRVAGDLYHSSQVTTAPPAPPTQGNLFQPMATGTRVEGSTRTRMEREDRERAERRAGTPPLAR
jgi:short-subunit dehydrogenase